MAPISVICFLFVYFDFIYSNYHRCLHQNARTSTVQNRHHPKLAQKVERSLLRNQLREQFREMRAEAIEKNNENQFWEKYVQAAMMDEQAEQAALQEQYALYLQEKRAFDRYLEEAPQNENKAGFVNGQSNTFKRADKS